MDDVIDVPLESEDAAPLEPFNVEAALLRKRELELEKKRTELVKRNGIAFYKPHPGQDRFHRAGDKKFRMVRCGNRYGKSTMGCAEDVAWLIGKRPWYIEGDPARYAGLPQRAVKGLVITTDWDKVREVWSGDSGKLWTFLPAGSVKSTRRNHSGAVDEIVLNNGSILRFDTVQSFKKDPQGSESSDWDFVHIDEPCPELMFVAAARGLVDRGGSAWFTLTPLHEFWINDLFFPQKGTKPKFEPSQIWAMQGNTRENPHLTAAGIEAFTALLTPDEIECRLNGIPLELSGLVYKQFNYEKHVLTKPPRGWGGFDDPPRDYVVHVAIDTHPQTPHAVLFVAVNQLGQRFIYDELFVKTDAESLANLILMKLHGRVHGDIKCEPAAWINDPVTESCLAEEFGKHGLYVQKASKAKTFGILKMQGEFRKEGSIYINPQCQRFLWELNRYAFDKENKPADKDDHLMECMYRIFINDPQWYDEQSDNTAVADQAITGDLDYNF
jgi:hypothetical protein